ncbi:MAG: hypothetical protein ABFD75_13045 [Smithella sp.]
MNEIVFKPQYERGVFSAYVFFLVLSGCLALMVISDPYTDINLTFITIISIPLLALAPLYIYKEIRFGQCITFRRYLYRDKIINYRDIVDYDGNTIKWSKGIAFSFVGLKNADEFREIMNSLIDRNIILKSQFDDSIALLKADMDEAGMIGYIIILPLILLFVLPLYLILDAFLGISIEINIYFLGYFLLAIITGISFWIIRHKKNKRGSN